MGKKRKNEEGFFKGLDSRGRVAWKRIVGYTPESVKKVRSREDLRSEIEKDLNEASCDYAQAMTGVLAAYEAGNDEAYEEFVHQAARIQETISSMTSFQKGINKPLMDRKLWQRQYFDFKKKRNLVDEDNNPTNLVYNPMNSGTKKYRISRRRYAHGDLRNKLGIKTLIEEEGASQVFEQLNGESIQGYEQVVENFKRNYKEKMNLSESPYRELFDDKGDFKKKYKDALDPDNDDETYQKSTSSKQENKGDGVNDDSRGANQADAPSDDRDYEPDPYYDDETREMPIFDEDQEYDRGTKYYYQEETKKNGEFVEREKDKPKSKFDPEKHSILRLIEKKAGVNALGNLRTTMKKKVGPFWIMVGKDSFRKTFPYFVPSSISLQVHRYARVRIFSDKFGSSFSTDLPGGFSFRGKDRKGKDSFLERVIQGAERKMDERRKERERQQK